MLPYQIIAGGYFTSDSTLRKEVQVNDRPDLIWVRNRTAWGDDAAETSVESWWRLGMAQDAAQTTDQAVTSGILSSEAVTSGGFRVYTTAAPPTYSANGVSGITAAEPAVVSVDSSTGSIQVGDVVRLTETTGMLQIAGYDFTVDAVTTNTSVTIQLDAQNFAAAATDGNVRLIIPGRQYPRWRYIVPLEDAAGITVATQAVVTTSVNHDFTVGEIVSFRVSSAFGMDEINNRQGKILSVGNMTEGAVYTPALTGPFNAFKVDIDTSGFSAFAFPTSAIAAAGISPAIVVPVGAGAYPSASNPYVPTDAAFDNRNKWLITMGSNVITSASAVYDWVAFKYDTFTAE